APRDSFKIPASCFFPEPEVESACITLIRRPAPLLPASTRKVFSRIVKRSFSQRRKMVLKLLKADWPADALQETFAELGISAQARAENVSLEQFVQLSARMAAAAGSAEEIFDVVNENDEVIGSAPRGEVHRTGAMHRATHVLAFNQRGEVFLQKRSMLKDRQPGKWDSSASGHVDSGESYDACAVRELREELGWTADAPLEKLFKLTAGAETDQEHVWVYRCAAEGPFQLLASEIERGDWFEPRAVTEWMNRSPEDFAPAFRLVWKRLTTIAPPAGNPKHETRNPK
ncbi:MAG TPA: NUDIX domain-containing protein, partial [Verrucomicrobiae bacterium]|nr:NUDIX domain-containing protein [Verrucomicrobiae bacterium]